MADAAWRSLRAASQLIVGRRLDLHVEGAEWIPPSGPVIIAARHFHHLYDGCAILAQVPRPVYLLVALDWVGNRPGRIAMDLACRAAAWPVVLRRDGATPVAAGETLRAARRAATETVALLQAGRIVLVFPEGYPNIDPSFTPKTDDEAFLPFQPGFVRLARMAAEHGLDVPIVPAGLAYRRCRRWRVVLRFGEPLVIGPRSQDEVMLRETERRVRLLSAPPAEDAPGDSTPDGPFQSRFRPRQ